MKKKKYATAETKAKALQGLRDGATLKDVAKQFGVHPVTVSKWKKDAKSKRKAVARPKAIAKTPTTDLSRFIRWAEIGRKVEQLLEN